MQGRRWPNLRVNLRGLLDQPRGSNHFRSAYIRASPQIPTQNPLSSTTNRFLASRNDQCLPRKQTNSENSEINKFRNFRNLIVSWSPGPGRERHQSQLRRSIEKRGLCYSLGSFETFTRQMNNRTPLNAPMLRPVCLMPKRKFRDCVPCGLNKVLRSV